MKPRCLIALALTVAAVSSLSCRTASQRLSQEERQKKEMEAWEAYMRPGKEHELLAKRTGTWDYKARIWTAPDATPSESKGKSEFKMVMGGRYRIDTTDGEGLPEFGGHPFQGMGFAGYDNFKKKYVGSWIDSMGTGILVGEGDASKDGKELAFSAEMPDIAGTMGQKTIKLRWTEKDIDDDHFSFAMYMPGPDGKEFKSFEFEYTRRK